MNKYLLYIIGLTAFCTLLFACSEHTELDTGTGKRAVTLNLSVSTRAIEMRDGGSEGTHGTLKVWVFEESSEKALMYREYTQVRWNKLVPTGEETPEYVTSIIEKLALEKESLKLSVHVVINAESVVDGGGTSLAQVLGANTTEDELTACVFNLNDATQQCKGNELLIYGHNYVEAVLDPYELFNMNIEAKRCLSRLEVYFTQNSGNAHLKIKNITLAKRPKGGKLVHPAADAALPTTTDAENAPITILDNPAGESITAILGSDIPATEFYNTYTTDPTTFDPIPLTQPILTERAGIGTNGKNDNVQGTEDAYILTVTYDKGSTGNNTLEENLTKTIALGNVPRNTRYMVFLRASVEVPIEVYTSIIGWEEGMGVSDPFDVTDPDINK